MRKSLISLAALAVATTAAAPAMAQDDSGITISGEATVVSDYRFRGVSFSDKDFAIQGSISASHESGLYIGTWGSSLASSVGAGGTEIDLYGGFATDLTDAISADVGLTYYTYPDAPPGDFDYVEIYGSLGTTVGPVDASIGAAYTPEQDAYGDIDLLYLWVDGGVGIPNTPVSLTAHVGRTTADAPEDNDYFDWSVGASVSYDALTFGVAYVDTDIPEALDPNADAGVVFSLSAGF